MIIFNNWQISVTGLIARQYDNLSRRIDVEGDLPAGYTWQLLVQCGGNADTILLEATETGAGALLTADNLSRAGEYYIQLRGVLEADGVTRRHTNVVSAYIPESLTGLGTWPEVPTEFSQVEARILELYQHPPIPGSNGYWLVWDTDKDEYVESKLALPEVPVGPQGPQGEQGPQGPQGPKGDTGSDANVTAGNIESALGYTPASADHVTQLKQDLEAVDSRLSESITEISDIRNEYLFTKKQKANLFDKSAITAGSYHIPNGGIQTASGFIESDFIPFEFGKSYRITFDVNWFPNYFSVYSSDKTQRNVIGSVPSSWTKHNASPYKELNIPYSAVADGKFISDDIAYIKFAFYNLNADNIMTVKDMEYPSEYIPFGNEEKYADKLDEHIKSFVPSVDISFLNGKKWCACGDSFTAGDFNDYTDSDGKSGKQSDAWDVGWNMWRTYPYWIGKRHNMTIVNEAISGSVLVNKDGANNPFCVQRYLNVPLDSDYVTIAFGLNENSIGDDASKIGTKTDTVDTTLWGAYNKIFTHFYTNMPYAKVGVILNDSWLSENYKNAVKQICEYWGIRYLDLGAKDMPLGVYMRTSTQVSSVAQNARNNAFYVSPNNGHPNVKAHQYRSTYIEEWLKTL